MIMPHISNGDNFKRRPFYLEHFSGVDVILELGVATGYTSKMFMMCAAKKVIGVDIASDLLNIDDMHAVAAKNNVEYEFILDNTLTMDPIESDVLFLDTSHEEEATYTELKKFAPATKKIIAIHDISPNFDTLKGVDRWLIEDGKDWEEFYRDYNICGLLVFKRKL